MLPIRTLGWRLLLAAGFSLPVLAQGNVIVVDAANGPGAQFTDLQPAVDAALDGDTLIVRSGGYLSFSTSKGLTVLAEPGASVVQSSSLLLPPVHIHDLPAGSTFVLRGLSLDNVVAISDSLAVEDCDGLVLIESVDATGPPAGATGIRIVDCLDARIQDCQARGAPAIEVLRSHVVITDTEARGLFSILNMPGGTGLHVENGSAIVSRGVLQGGSAFFAQGTTPPGPGLRMLGAEVTVTGDPSTVVGAGGNHPMPIPAIDGTGGALRLHGSVQLVSNSGAPAVATTIPTSIVDVPSLRATGTGLGGTVDVELYGRAGAVYAIVLGLPGPRTPLPGLGALGLDPTGPTITVGPGLVPATRTVGLQVSVPVVASLLGQSFAWQAIDGTPATGFLLSNPATYALGS